MSTATAPHHLPPAACAWGRGGGAPPGPRLLPTHPEHPARPPVRPGVGAGTHDPAMNRFGFDVLAATILALTAALGARAAHAPASIASHRGKVISTILDKCADA